MNKMIKFLFVTSLVLAVLSLILAFITQTYWVWGFYLWDFDGPALYVFVASVTLFVSSGILKLAEVNARLVIATLVVFVLSYHVKYLDVSRLWSASPAEVSQGNYVFTTDWVTRNELVWTEKLKHLRGRPNVRALEIGSFEGRSAVWFLENILTHPSSSIVCIDIFDGPFENLFDANLAGFKGRMKKIKASSHAGLRTLQPNSYDFIYVDGSHTAKDVFLDVALSWDLLKSGGILIFDDYEWKGFYGRLEPPALVPKPALDAFLQVFEPYIEVLHKEYQLIVKKRERIDRSSPQLKITSTRGT